MTVSEAKQKIWKTVTPVILAVTLVFGVYATDSKEYNSPGFTEINTKKPKTCNMTGEEKIKKDSGKIENNASYTETNLLEEEIYEEDIEIKEWMLNANDKFWSNNEQENEEEEMKIEEWMIDLSCW